MVITAEDFDAALALTDNDYIITRPEDEPDLIRFALPWAIDVSLHVRAETPIVVHLYPTEFRAMVRFGGFSDRVDVFLSTEQIDRLINVLTVARSCLV